MTMLAIDLETYSELDIKKVGGYKYAENCELLLFGFAYDKDPVTVLDIVQADKIPEELIQDVKDNRLIKTAYNAQFERTVLSNLFNGGQMFSASSWYCTMVASLYLGFPGGLDNLMKLLHPHDTDKQKLAAGKALVKYFCSPCKPSKANGNRLRNRPQDNPDKWKTFKQYNRQDVETERDARNIISKIPLPEKEHHYYVIDQSINDQGVATDEELIAAVQQLNDKKEEEYYSELKEITMLANPKSNKQFKDWLNSQGVETDSVDKAHLDNILQFPLADLIELAKTLSPRLGISKNEDTYVYDTRERVLGYNLEELKVRMLKVTTCQLINNCDKIKAEVDKLLQLELPFIIKQAIHLKLLLSKSSIKKYQTMVNAKAKDNRMHGLLQFYGANRTGRFAGRLVQVQNLARNDLKEISLARDLVRAGDEDMLELFYGETPFVLSQLVRTVFVPHGGYEYHISDYHAIEAVVLAWMAGEQWVLDVFKKDGMIYETTAAQMYHVEKDSIVKIINGKETHGENYSMRAHGKRAVLSCGYGGGPNALIRFCADKAGMTAEEMQDTVNRWRAANTHSVDLWHELEGVVREAITFHKPGTAANGKLKVSYKWGLLAIQLPSGRSLYYVRPKMDVEETKFGKHSVITYEGVDQTNKQWCTLHTWGGKLVENCTQAIARDILCNALDTLYKHGMHVVMHVHDEVICEEPTGKYKASDIDKLMAEMPAWCEGIPLTAKGFTSQFYMKD